MKEKTFYEYRKIMRMYSKKLKISYLGLLCITIGLELVNACSAYISAKLVDFVNTNKNMNKVFFFAFLILAMYVVCTSVSLIRCYISSKINCNLEYGVREDYLDIIQQSTYLSALSKESTEVYYRMFTDIGSMVMYYINFQIDIPTALISIIVCIGLMFYWSPIMTAIIIGLSIVQVVITNIIKKPISKSTKAVIEAENGFVKLIGDIFSGIENVKILGMEKGNTQKINVLSTSIKKKKVVNTVIASVLSSFVSLFGQFGTLSLLIIGCYLIINDRLTIGQYMGFMSIISMFSSGINSVVNFVFDFEKVKVSFERYKEFCKEYNTYEYGGNEHFLLKKELKLENVSFGYIQGNLVLDCFNLSLQKGKMVGFIGDSGCGKSTVGKIIMRLLKPQSGKVYIDDVDVTQIKHSDYKDAVCYMSQIPYIFYGSLYDNLTVGMKPDVNEKYYDHVLEITGVKNIIQKLEAKEDTIIGKGATLLSVGESQRISMARLLLRKPKIVVLDEPTSSLNKKYDELIVDIFGAYAKENDAIVILITHKDATINLLEEVYKISDGKVEKL